MRNLWGWAGTSQPAAAAEAKEMFDLSLAPKPGFIGNLDALQHDALNALRMIFAGQLAACVDCREELLFFSKDEESQAALQKGEPLTEVDVVLLRFLRARGFDVPESAIMLQEYLKWRLSFRLKEVCEVVRFPWIQELRRVYPHGYHGVDRIGRPIYIERVGKSDMTAALKIAPLDHLLAYWVQQYEYSRRVVMPACSVAAGRRVEQGVSVVDLSGMKMSHCGSRCRKVMRQLAKLSQDYFPEMLGAMVVVNAPSVFTPVWSLIKSIVDKKTVSKIHLISSSSKHWKQYLQQLVDPSQLPEFLGGTAPDEGWEMNRGPWTDPAILAQVELLYPAVPKNFVHLDLRSGAEESLQALAGIDESVLAVEPSGSDAEIDKEIDAKITENSSSEINELEKVEMDAVD